MNVPTNDFAATDLSPEVDERSRVRTGVMVAVMAAVVLLSVVHIDQPTSGLGQTVYLIATVGAGVIAWLSVRRRVSAVRVLIALGVSLSALGDITYQIYVSTRGAAPDVSVGDVFWIGSYVALAWAMLLLLRTGPRTTRSDLDGLIDMAVIALVAVVMLWELWLSSTFTDDSVPLFVRCVWAFYPVFDAMLVALVLRTMVERRSRSTMGALVAAGVCCWLISDFWYMIAFPDGIIGALLDVGWMVGAVLIGAACWYQRPGAVVPNDLADPADEVGKASIVLAMGPLLVPGCVELVSYLRGRDANPVPLLAATALFAALAGARAMRLVRLRDQARVDLAASDQLYRALTANSSDAVLMLDPDGRIINEVPALAALVGHPGEQTQGQHAIKFVDPSDADARHLLDEALRSPGVPVSGEIRMNRVEAGDLWLSARVVNLLEVPAVRAIVVNLHDITDRKRAEDELVHQAFHDSLTGLANRALFRDRVDHALSRRLRSGLVPAVIYLDLDGFKKVNDGLGHDAGDTLLRDMAARLATVVRVGDTVARLGGDEFAILVEEAQVGSEEARAVADRALEALTTPMTIDGHVVVLSASLGIAHAQETSTGATLLRDADIAMYQAKAAGKARWMEYNPGMSVFALEHLELENALATAVANDELRLLYQPVIELESNRIVGFEALIRWHHPELGTIMPDRFIPIAEENGAIIEIGRWVLQEACRTAAGWRGRYPGDFTMAVNLSGRQLAAPEICDHVRAALDASGLAAAALVLEMTETALVKDPNQAAVKLHQLRELGVRIAIDDFGTGYSSLSYLRQFPVDILKIDRSFINTIVDRDNVPAIVRGVLDLARTLQLEIIAEGIESNEQLGQLRDEKCELGQGFLFSRPIPPEQAEQLLFDAQSVFLEPIIG